jgi:lipopolysaccharide/colanic/teichoic acid biosynthesis glycosyltransferase
MPLKRPTEIHEELISGAKERVANQMSELASNILRSRATLRSATTDVIPLEESFTSKLLAEDAFTTMLSLERKRTARSQRRFVLMLLESSTLLKGGNNLETLDKVLFALSRSTRETDIKGWYKEGCVLGVIFTEIGAAEGKSVANALLTKVINALCGTLGIEHINEIRLSFHVFPEYSSEEGPGVPPDSSLYPDLEKFNRSKTSRFLKRAIDIAGSLLALTLLSPVLLAVAAAIKLSSSGPILFRQQRVGQHGKKFTFLKFRSMYFTEDHTIHREYVKRLISGVNGSAHEQGSRADVYKLTNDPRVTPIGRILRRTSIDEVPQFMNVLTGQMSLVGPRPPIPYEFESYDLWHVQRLLAVKPGITGLWQVEGRSRVTFDEMVRLDLKYASSWSVWLDLKILLRTPGAVLSGAGAY